MQINNPEFQNIISQDRKEDISILKRCLNKDEAAWKKLIDKYGNLVFNICLQFTGKNEIAEELTQDIFIKVYKNLYVLKKHPNFKWWLIKTAKNQCIDYYRRNKKEKVNIDFKKVSNSLIFKKDSEGEILFSEKIKILHKGILKLPLSLRTLIVLRDIQELSYEEIAKMLKIPLGTVKSKLNRARITLVKILETFNYFDA